MVFLWFWSFLIFLGHIFSELEECIMRNLRNYLTDSLFQWRIRTAWSLAFISGVGKKNRVIRSEVIVQTWKNLMTLQGGTLPLERLLTTTTEPFNQCDPVSDLRGPFFVYSRTIPCTISCTFFDVKCTISCTFWAISCTKLCTIYFVHVHFSQHNLYLIHKMRLQLRFWKIMIFKITAVIASYQIWLIFCTCTLFR